ncbi:alpha-ketoglutarate-dependent dioxygenase AlkB family protein [Robiginitalea sp. IMCC44478]|uniref:alpha-ketoglutarate-dependent dioxygenase AlkB family protein n=1 Tax=Robiginitalea sp. IMCC44478 TaxID=3459122 RepID=UPI004042B5C1
MKDSREPELIQLPDAELLYQPDFLDLQEADAFFSYLRNDVPWQQDDIRVFGKTYAQPRLTALFGLEGKPYTYSGITMLPHPFPERLNKLKAAVEKQAGVAFTSCLLNLYRDGNDSNGWHADNEKELGQNPVIASVSLGETRKFKMKHRRDKNLKYDLELVAGSLLIMKGSTQHHWLHQVPKTKKPVGERINLTFRRIY